MKTNSKKSENPTKQLKKHSNIQSIEADQTQFKQDGKNSTYKMPVNTNKGTRYSQNLKNVNLAYGSGPTTIKNKHHKNRPQNDNSNRKEQKPRKNTQSQFGSFQEEKLSTIKSLKAIQIQRLNGQILDSNTTSVNNDFIFQIQPVPVVTNQVRIQNKRTASSPPTKIQEKSFIQDKEKRKNNTIIQQKPLNKDKLKDLYDKIRNPQKPSRFAEESTVSQIKPQKRQKEIERSPQRKNIQKQQYLQAITGRSVKKIQSERNITDKTNLSPQQLLSGKFSIIWIFAIKSGIKNQIQDRIIQMYNPLLDDDRAVPFVQNPKKIRQFLEIPHCYFKIVTDMASAQIAIGFRIYNTVIQFHIWNDTENVQKALQLKSITRKVKGIFTDWDKILTRAQDQIQQQISIYKCNNGLQKRQRQRKFPNFLKLTDTDKTQATLYRINLYGAIKLLAKQKKQSYDDFMRLVLSKYQKNQDQQQNIQDYIKIDHHKQILTLSQSKLIIQFYVRQSFYYQILNSMLRTMKTSEQFKPCILPFNQTYHSIRLYYNNFLKQSSYQINQMTLYRGCKLSKKDFKHLNKPGVFVEMLGFMSTSKSEERAKDFVDRDGYMFVIHVKRRKVDLNRFKNFDHGFVDINRYGLASIEFSRQEQVLFNALNVYQVQKVEQKDDYTYIHLNYGVIFDLLQKPKQKLTQDQYDTLVNYYYCTKILGKIQDQGDVFLFANQLEQAKKYYDKKIKQGDNLAHNYYKLANVQKQCGQIDQAQQNANKALQLFSDTIDKNDRQNCLKVFSIHSKNAQISLQKQDYLTADESIDKALSMLSDQQIFQKGVKLRERGQIKFKKGQIKNAQKDFQQSQSIFQNIRTQASIRKVAAYKHYYLSHLSLLCSSRTRDDLKNQLRQQLNKIKEMEQKISRINQDIEDQLVKINKSLKDVSLYVQDRQKYEIYVKKAQSYLFSLQARKANDPQLKAKLLSMQAMIADYQTLAESQKLMNQAIKLIESKNPFDMKVADYSKILAKMQKSELQKFRNPGKKLMNQKPDVPIPYNHQQRKQIYQRCKNNFNKTIKVLMYHAKDKSSPQVLQIKNQLGQLAFEQSDYAQCQKIIKQVKEGKQQIVHSQMAKTLIIMARISYARGQLKNAFQTLDQAYKVLQKAMVLKHQKQNSEDKIQKYKNLFQNSDTYLIIKFVYANIYHKQKNHDLALKNLQEIGNTIIKKVGMNDSHPMLADLLEMRGCLQVFKGNIYDFDQYFEKAIQLREKQFGRFHPVNGKTYCSYAKFLIMVKDKKRAIQMLNEAVEVFSAFDQNNPNYWTMFYSQGFFNEDKNQFQISQNFYNKSLKWVQKYFNKSHITIKQVMLTYANSLTKSRKLAQSKHMYEQLQQQLDEGIRQSKTRSQLNSQQDDQKVSLKKLMYTQLTQLQTQEMKQNESYMAVTNSNLIDTSLYKSKLSLLRNQYNLIVRQQKNNNRTKSSQFKKQYFQTSSGAPFK